MTHLWMFEVLRDLETYARRNGLPGLAADLSAAAGQAARELAVPIGPEPSPPAPRPAR